MPDATQDSSALAASNAPADDATPRGSRRGSRAKDPGQQSESKSPKNNSDGADREASGGKTRKRRKVNHACVYCRRSHMTCDQERPCSRCIKRSIGHLCHDEPREPKRGKHDDDTASSPNQTQTENGALGVANEVLGHGDTGLDMSTIPLPQTSPTDPAVIPQPNAAAGNLNQAFPAGNRAFYGDFGPGPPNQFQDSLSNFMFNTSEVTNEYNLLNDFLSTSLIDDPSLYPSEDPQSYFSDPSFANTMGPLSTSNTPVGVVPQQSLAAPAPQPGDRNSTARSNNRQPMDRREEKYYLTAADPAGRDSPEERMNKLLRAKYEAGLLKPYNYVEGYARLQKYMEQNLQPGNRQRILMQLDRFRPQFRERMQQLKDIELVLVEMWFERKLMEYDRVFASMAIPACCWRRTGQIFRGNKEMAELIRVNVEQLRDGKLGLHEIIDEDSLVSYWEKFGGIAFKTSQKAILTSCTLKSPNSKSKDRELKCCFSFTIQRDQYSIPSLIIGNFLPQAPMRR